MALRRLPGSKSEFSESERAAAAFVRPLPPVRATVAVLVPPLLNDVPVRLLFWAPSFS